MPEDPKLNPDENAPAKPVEKPAPSKPDADTTDVDLTAEGAVVPATQVVEKDLSFQRAPPAAPPPDTRPFNVEAAQERIRGVIAGALVVLLFVIVVASFAIAWQQTLPVADIKSLLEVLLAPVVALVGSATGFYFGGRNPGGITRPGGPG